MGKGKVDIVGLGPGSNGLLDVGIKEQIQGVDLVYLRTSRHPSAETFLSWCRDFEKEVVVLDQLYESAESFDQVYEEIVKRVVKEAESGRSILYAVPGSPSVGERTVVMLRNLEDLNVEVHPSLSVLDLAWSTLNLDPIDGVTVVDCHDLLTDASRFTGSIFVMQCYSADLVNELMTLAEESDSQVTVLYHLGLAEEAVRVVEGYRWPLPSEPDHLTSIFLADFQNPSSKLGQLWETIRILRVQCPWDSEQTHQSLSRHLLEESYEVVEAIDEMTVATNEEMDVAMDHLREELGDILIQVLFHSNLARESGWFSIEDVASSTDKKLKFRHPHVFGNVQATTAAEVVANWEQLKRVEKSRSSVLEGLSADLPSTLKAEKLYRKFKGLGGSLALLTSHSDEVASLFDDAKSASSLYVAALEALESKVDLDGVFRRLSSVIVEAVVTLEGEINP